MFGSELAQGTNGNAVVQLRLLWVVEARQKTRIAPSLGGARQLLLHGHPAGRIVLLFYRTYLAWVDATTKAATADTKTPAI